MPGNWLFKMRITGLIGPKTYHAASLVDQTIKAVTRKVKKLDARYQKNSARKGRFRVIDKFLRGG